MKKNTLTTPITMLILVALATGAIISLSGCAGPAARDEVLMPLARGVWPRIQADIERGLEDSDLSPEDRAVTSILITDLTDILERGDRSALMAFPWMTLEPWAVAGVQARVDAGELGENGASLHYQRIVNFREVLEALGNRLRPGVFGRTTRREGYLVTDGGRTEIRTWVNGTLPPGFNVMDPAWSDHYRANIARQKLGVELVR
jgi:hypothetical protein